MQSAKVIVGLFVIALAGAFSVYIFVSGKINSFPSGGTAGTISSTSNDIAAAAIKNYISEKLPKKIADQEAADTQNGASTPAVDTNNLTEMFASELAKEVVIKNPQGPFTADDGSQKLNFPGSLDYDSFLKEAKSNGDRTDWRKVITPEEQIKAIPDNSKEAIVVYLTAMKDVLSQKSQTDLSFSQNVADISAVTNAGKVFGTKVASLLDGIRTISVPDKFVAFHGGLIQIFKGKGAAFKKLENSENDPLSALVATGWLQDINKEEAALGQNLLATIQASVQK